MNTAQFISHHLFVAAVGKPAASYDPDASRQEGVNSSSQPARPAPLEIVDNSQPLPASLLRTMSPASTGAS